MLKSTTILNKPKPYIVKFLIGLRYLRVGLFLHTITVFSVVIFITSFQKLDDVNFVLNSSTIIWYFLILFGVSVVIISQLDAYGRFQNYKQLKDKFFEYGFNTRLVRPFMFSKCQRDAVLVAAEDFDSVKELKAYFHESGYRWYHIVPDACLKYPLIVFSKEFWSKILFTKYYHLQNYDW